MHSSEPIIIELNDLKIKKISCGREHSLLLSCDGDIYAFGWNRWGEIGNGTQEEQRFPIKLELNNKFIDIASHYYYPISMSQSFDGISNMILPVLARPLPSFDSFLTYTKNM